MDNNTDVVQRPIYGTDPSIFVTNKKGFTSLYDPDLRFHAQKILDFYDGNQKPYLEKTLKEIRRNAMESGMQARTRNVLRMIVDKSGMLFSGKPPTLEVELDNPDDSVASDTDTIDPKQTVVANQFFDSANWIEFFTNLDAVVRMLKTALVMVYWVEAKNAIKFIILDQHNTAVHYDENTGVLDTLIYATGQTVDAEGNILATYRVWTEGLIQDIVVDSRGEERIINVEANPYLMIPAACFHDTNIPRQGFWNPMPNDLVEVNEIYNIHISDTEYAAAWNKHQTAVTNAEIRADDSSPDFVEKQLYLNPLTRRVQAGGPAAIGGPGRIIHLETVSGQTTYFEYKGPQVDLLPMDEMFKNMVIDFAADWSVNASIAGNGSADSGFKLIVQEMPNLELRRKRQKMFEAGFERLFEVMKVVVNHWLPSTFSDNAELCVEFHNPELPVDEKNNEQVWSLKIAEGRASRIDYLMEVKGLDEDEALLKLQEIMKFNNEFTSGTIVLPSNPETLDTED
jgi:hypothetical protein